MTEILRKGRALRNERSCVLRIGVGSYHLRNNDNWSIVLKYVSAIVFKVLRIPARNQLN